MDREQESALRRFRKLCSRYRPFAASVAKASEHWALLNQVPGCNIWHNSLAGRRA